jgi:hypothetical protein
MVQACVNFGADVVAPGVVMRGSRGTFKIGELDGTPTARIGALAADIAGAEPTTQSGCRNPVSRDLAGRGQAEWSSSRWDWRALPLAASCHDFELGVRKLMYPGD